jgi:hypothetical protein
MKRCPTCNQEFTDQWLTFCTQDGTPLVETDTSPVQPPPTLWPAPPMPPSVSPMEQPTLDMPDRYQPPGSTLPQPATSVWRPPPAPAYPVAPQQNLAVVSLVLGIISVTVGWCCSFGILTSPVALVTGIIALVQIKNDPNKYGGKGFAIGGIIMGSLYLAILVVIFLLYGIGILMGGIR